VSELSTRLLETFGEIDIHLFDQLLRGRITEGMRVLDAGCGAGRNLVYLMREGFDVWGVDERPESIVHVRRLASRIAPQLEDGRFRVELVEAMSFADASMDAVISSAVLHFARDEAHWMAMVRGMWRVLKPGGVLFARLATSVGQQQLRPLGGRRFILPDGSARYLVDHELLIEATRELGGELIDAVRSTVVHELRSMGTWVVRKL